MKYQTQHPKPVNVFYHSEIKKLLKHYYAAIEQQVVPMLERFEYVYIADSKDGLLAAILNAIDDIGTLFQDIAFQKVAKAFINRNLSWQTRNSLLAKKELKMIKMPQLINTYGLADELSKTYTENIELIKTVPANFIQDIKGSIRKSFEAGDKLSTVKANIKSIYKQQDWKIERIARTETAKLNISVNRLQAESIGVNSYTWITAADERTCSVCGPLNGTIRSFNDSPLPGFIHPNDRCSMKINI